MHEKSGLLLKPKAIVSFTTRTAANEHTECPTNLKHLCYPTHLTAHLLQVKKGTYVLFCMTSKRLRGVTKGSQNGSEVMGGVVG